MKSLLKNFFIFFIVLLVISGIFSLFNNQKPNSKEITLNELAQEIIDQKVKEIVVEENKLNIALNTGESQFSFKEEGQSLSELLNNYNIPSEKLMNVGIKIKNLKNRNFLLTVILPFIIPLLLLLSLLFFFTRKMQGAGMQAMKFGESKAKNINSKDKKIKTTFKDVAGIEEAKEELYEIVDFLKKPKKYIALGAKIPKGVLLIGPPGCGKTLVARAVAGEGNVPFFHISGSEFVEMFVGVGASRVRDVFRKAKKNLPAILFIDELDAVGRQRGTGVGGSHDEREQTLNQILVELDGFEPNIGLIVIAATNRPDILDPALLRPGRFDRKVILNLPDIKQREAILKIHAKNKPLKTNINLRNIAERTPGFSGADLESLLNEAAISAAKNNKRKIDNLDIINSIEKVLLGPERKSHILTKKEKEIVAYHEAGHALVSYYLPGCDQVQKISIISRGQAAGYTLRMPKEEKSLRSKSEFMNDIAILLGGYISEKIKFKEITTGAANDLKRATYLANKLVTEYGMSKILGPRTFGETHEMVFLGREISEKRNFSEKTALLIDQEISKFINSCYEKAKNVLTKNNKKLEKIAKLLLKKETLEKNEFAQAMKK
ncbi:cell division protein FtsH [Candidatus Parcubacteria bacterium 4484_255]|nr:MAG: cell division protein FtsH [Candidatus Parcubacteria bacterium 4484_255]